MKPYGRHRTPRSSPLCLVKLIFSVRFKQLNYYIISRGYQSKQLHFYVSTFTDIMYGFIVKKLLLFSTLKSFMQKRIYILMHFIAKILCF